MDLTIIVVSFNTRKLTRQCLDSIVKHTKGISYEIIVVDNASTDGSISEVEKFTTQAASYKVKIIKNSKNIGFGAANNQAMKISRGRYVLLLNSDTLLDSNVLFNITKWMDSKSEIGISSCMLKNVDGSIQGTGGYFPTLPRVFAWMTIQDLPFVDRLIKPFHPMHTRSILKGSSFYAKEKELDWITGAFFLIRREVVDQVGYFDQDYFMYTEETDYCYRAKSKGWKVYYQPKWGITHLGGGSGKSWSFVVSEYEGVKLFYKKHYPLWHLPLIRIFLKIGALGRMVVFGVLEGKEAYLAYARAFKIA